MQALDATHWLQASQHHCSPPIANGIVERLHHQLKVALKISSHSTHWTDSLPLVNLRTRTAWKDDLHCSAAELVYGTSLQLSGKFFNPTIADTTPDSTGYVNRRNLTMQQLRPTLAHKLFSRKSHISVDLSNCTRVFVQHDAVHKPLQPPYDGPYKVLYGMTNTSPLMTRVSLTPSP